MSKQASEFVMAKLTKVAAFSPKSLHQLITYKIRYAKQSQMNKAHQSGVTRTALDS